MAYNNYFPIGYQYMYPQPFQTQQEAISPVMQGNTQGMNNGAQNGIIWVQGEAGAKAYPIAPNTTVQLWDSEDQVIYLKSADASGMPSMKILDYTIRETGKAVKSDYVTREEFEKAISELRRGNESIVSTVRKRKSDDGEV